MVKKRREFHRANNPKSKIRNVTNLYAIKGCRCQADIGCGVRPVDMRFETLYIPGAAVGLTE